MMGEPSGDMSFMCRKRALVATLLAPAILLGAPAAFAADAAKPAPAPAAEKVAAPVKASPQQRK